MSLLLGATALLHGLSLFPLCNPSLLDRLPPSPDGDDRQDAHHNQNHRGSGGSAHHPSTICGPLPSQFGVRHIGRYPLTVKDALVDPIAYREVPIFSPRDSGESQDADKWIRIVIAYTFLTAYSGIKVQQTGQIGFAAQDSLAHEQ